MIGLNFTGKTANELWNLVITVTPKLLQNYFEVENILHSSFCIFHFLDSHYSQHMQPGLYRHYKGKDYRVYFTARHSETLEEMVCYEQLETGTFWVRPKQMFEELVAVGDRAVPRFQKIN